MSKGEVAQLVAEGVTIQPMQWVETDKNAHLRRDGKFIAADLKADLSDAEFLKMLMVFAQIRQQVT